MSVYLKTMTENLLRAAFVVASCLHWGSRHARAQSAGVNRSYFFRARTTTLPLGRTVPSNWTENDLPDSIAAVVVEENDDGTLMGPPIHVQSGDRLQLMLKNDVPYTGLSIHLHGLGAYYLRATV